jgi:Mrp family chromosome partitioning ATPase
MPPFIGAKSVPSSPSTAPAVFGQTPVMLRISTAMSAKEAREVYLRGLAFLAFLRDPLSRCSSSRLLQVASPRTGEGATTLAANLAVVLAAAGKRVVFVEEISSAFSLTWPVKLSRISR